LRFIYYQICVRAVRDRKGNYQRILLGNASLNADGSDLDHRTVPRFASQSENDDKTGCQSEPSQAYERLHGVELVPVDRSAVPLIPPTVSPPNFPEPILNLCRIGWVTTSLTTQARHLVLGGITLRRCQFLIGVRVDARASWRSRADAGLLFKNIPRMSFLVLLRTPTDAG
jgi:hypothetical protein